ncbi:unnamed protein product, partial [Meganyctiphanes norvegica]
EYKMELYEKLNLKWDNHKTNFFEFLKNQREKSNYTDATLAVEGKFYPVHKLVLSSCSEYFSDIFERTNCKSPVIVLKDVPSHDIEALLDYMYLGEVDINRKNLKSLLKTAECLRITGLLVSEDDATNLDKKSTTSHGDANQDSPPPKRRRQGSNTTHPHAISPVSSPQKSAGSMVNPVQTSSTSSHLTTNTSSTEQDELTDLTFVKVEIDDAEELNTKQDELPAMKFEIDSFQEHNENENFRREINNEGVANHEQDPLGNYGSGLSKTRHNPENYGNSSFPGPSQQQIWWVFYKDSS